MYSHNLLNERVLLNPDKGIYFSENGQIKMGR
jgi:hypothetical protein